MKKVKNLIVLMLSVMMLLSLSITVSAEGETYKITIKNSSSAITMDDTTYKAYKVLDVTYSGSDGSNPTNYAYTTNSAFQTFTYTDGSTVYNYKTIPDYISTLTANSDELNSFATAVKNFITENSVSEAGSVVGTTANTAEIDVTSSGAGYYLVTASAKTTDGDSDNVVAFCALTTTTSSSEVELKADVPTIDKAVKESTDTEYSKYADAQIGETLNFKLTATIPQYADKYDSYTYVIHDLISSGLTVDNSSIKVYSDSDLTNEIPTDNYSLKTGNNVSETDKSTCTFEVEVNSSYVKAKSGTSLYIAYNAVLNENAVIFNSNENNTAKIQYSNNPYDTSSTETTPEKEVKVYSYSFNVFKYYLNEETETGLSNAKFRLYSDNGCENEIAVVSSGTNSDGYNTYRVATTNETGVDIVSAENGYITVSGLDSSTQYYLKEVAAPDGYYLLENPIKVEIIANAKSDNTAVESITLKQDNTDVTVVKVLNQSGSILPVTGGIGTTIFYIVGGVIIVVALVLLIVRKRISDKKDKD